MTNMTKNKLAVIETGGKQYLVKPGMAIRIERIGKAKKGDIVYFEKVLLLVDKDGVKVGKPYINLKIPGKFIEEKKGRKITHLRYHAKTRHAVKKGHRQIYNEVVIGDF